MGTGFTYIGQERIDSLRVLHHQWLELIDYLIGYLEKNWKSQSVYAHFNPSNEDIIIWHNNSEARVRRKGDVVWFENKAGAEIEKLDEEHEQWDSGKKFLNWKTDKLVKEDICMLLDRMMKEFLTHSQKMAAALSATFRLDDIANGHFDEDDQD